MEYASSIIIMIHILGYVCRQGGSDHLLGGLSTLCLRTAFLRASKLLVIVYAGILFEVSLVKASTAMDIKAEVFRAQNA
jgi:hypothetical protein